MIANFPRSALLRSSYRLLAVVLILTACSSPATRPTSAPISTPVPVEKPARPATAELTVQALTHSLIIKEVPITYRSRPDGSQSLKNSLTGPVDKSLAIFFGGG